MKTLRRLMAVALALALASTAHAQGGMSLGWGQRPTPTQSGTNPQGQLKVAIVGGVNPAESTAQPLQYDEYGRLLTVDGDRDRDFPLITNLFSAVVLNQSTTFQPNNAKYIGQYSRAALMLNWGLTAASDSDTTFLAVRVWGKTSLNSGNLYLWTPMAGSVQPGDTCQCSHIAADSVNSGQCFTPAISFVVIRNVTNYALTTKVAENFVGLPDATKRATLRKLPAYGIRYAGTNGVMLNLSDNAGNPCPFPYILVEVMNLNFTRNLTSVTADVWPRVF